ncbi:hypothetical protein [Paraliomyxa miuraensis]|uniref:hypothetical protein n=1 Tax=Paraliomyxa miuraensis TaxID=376150 RepID=UPI002254DF1C|nr:hypothetical protein [Paraliomyxa miuraensis]MCX4243276.1 hypothetical protein [Paraliomyxa miuraensis]
MDDTTLMTQGNDAVTEPPKVESADTAWAESLREVMCKVISTLPDHATLGELIDAARANAAMAPVLGIFTVQELIDTARKRPKPQPKPKDDEIQLDEEGNPIMDLDATPAVIRRRADVPDGDLRVLRVLAERGAQRELDLANNTGLTGEQLRLLIRHLRAKGFVHVEGSGTKRRLKITRHGSGFLRRQS